MEKYIFLKLNDIKATTDITLDEINDYYVNNKKILCHHQLSLAYLRLSKESIISSIEISDSEVVEDYQKKT